MKIVYDPEVDTLHIWLQETTVTTKELADGVSADYNRNGQLAGIEILDAAKRLDRVDNLRQITLEGAGDFVAVWGSKYPGVPYGSYHAEALTWLQQDRDAVDNLSVGDSSDRLTPEDSLALVREFYAAGAVQVRVEGKYLDEIGEGADTLEIVLPEDAEARAALFAIQKRVMEETGSAFDPAEEEGQKSFTIGW